MIIGIPKELKINESRVSIIPENVLKLTDKGHTVFIETNAGLGSGYTDDVYKKSGAKICGTSAEVYAQAELILKVKEPQPGEYFLIRKDQIVFTYFHFASDEKLVNAMMNNGSVCIAYETVTNHAGRLPLLEPMSRIAGRLSVQEGARYLSKLNGGKGKLPGGIPGSPNSRALILGGGISGTEAAKVAIGMGMEVTLLDINETRLQELKSQFQDKIKVLKSTPETVEKELQRTDLIVGAVLVPGGKAPKLIQKKHLSLMEPKTVLVDIAIDQGGCMETSKPTTHTEPVYELEGIIHYAVTNMPGIVPATASQALSNATYPFLELIAENGWQQAMEMNPHLANGLNISAGKIMLDALKES